MTNPNTPTWNIRLGEAALCSDCDVIFLFRRGECPRCAGRQFIPLEQFMTKKEHCCRCLPGEHNHRRLLCPEHTEAALERLNAQYR